MSDSYDDNNDDLELEPVDPDILRHERQVAERKVRAAEASVDINEHYIQVEDQTIGLDDLPPLRFTTRHLLILTAVLAVIMTLFQMLEGPVAVALIAVVLLGGGYYYVYRHQRQRVKELKRQRRILEQRLADQPPLEAPQPDERQPGYQQTTWEPLESEREAIDFSFSLKQMFAALTVAAVVLGIATLLEPGNMALVLGLVALTGLVTHAVGYDPPRIVILGWWLTLVLYLILGLWSMWG